MSYGLRLVLVSMIAFACVPLAMQAQTVAEVARQTRAERQQQPAHSKVITNEDLEQPKPAPQPPTPKADDGATPATDTAAAGADAASAKTEAKPKPEEKTKDSDPDASAKELNQRYIDRINQLHEQISAAREDIHRLQRDQVESTTQFRRSNGIMPTAAEYEDQQRLFREQIAAKEKLISDLNTQLEDAREAARHAGVPHALDY